MKKIRLRITDKLSRLPVCFSCPCRSALSICSVIFWVVKSTITVVLLSLLHLFRYLLNSKINYNSRTNGGGIHTVFSHEGFIQSSALGYPFSLQLWGIHTVFSSGGSIQSSALGESNQSSALGIHPVSSTGGTTLSSALGGFRPVFTS